MITFQGNFKSSAIIKKMCDLSNYADSKAAFVELDPKLYEDREMLHQIRTRWCDDIPGGTYAVEIDKAFTDCYLKAIERGEDILDLSAKESPDRFFALTTQKQGYKILNPDMILGLSKTSKENPNKIQLDFLQVDPDNYHNARYRTYKQIGTALVEALKTIFKGNRIELFADFDAIPFYEKLGFQKVKNGKQNQLYIDA